MTTLTTAHPLDTQVGGTHYTAMPIQPITFIHANNMPFIEGNVVKYVARWRTKDGVADLKKARHYLDLLIALDERQNAVAATATPTKA